MSCPGSPDQIPPVSRCSAVSPPRAAHACCCGSLFSPQAHQELRMPAAVAVCPHHKPPVTEAAGCGLSGSLQLGARICTFKLLSWVLYRDDRKPKVSLWSQRHRKFQNIGPQTSSGRFCWNQPNLVARLTCLLLSHFAQDASLCKGDTTQCPFLLCQYLCTTETTCRQQPHGCCGNSRASSLVGAVSREVCLVLCCPDTIQANAPVCFS